MDSHKRSGAEQLERVDLGFGGLHATAGDHIGHFYRTRADWRELLTPFLYEGLATGDKCVSICPKASQQEILDALEAIGIDVENVLSSGQLLFDGGKSTPEELQDLLTSAIAEIPGKFRFLRWGGDMTWSLSEMPTTETLMKWETVCNVIDDPPAIFLCQYDLTQFLGTVVLDALKTHPLCIIGSTIHQNPYYEDPEVFLEELRTRAAA